MLYDIVFYASLLFSTVGSISVLKSASALNWFYKSIKGLFVLLCILLWAWQVLLWVLPKGSKLEEAVHLPRHLWTLDNTQLVENVNNQKKIYGENPKQYYMYYPAPEGSSKKNTVVFYIHGGGWCLGSPYQHQYLATLLQEKGYTLVLPAYRLVPDFSYKDLQEDINKALTESLLFLKEEGIDNPQLVIGGTSAGGNLAGLLAYDEQRWEDLGLDRNILQGAFSIAGVLDLNYMEQTYAVIEYAGSPDSNQYQLANPISWINQVDSFQFLCLHGDSDGLAAHANAASFCNKLEALSPNLVDFHTFKDGSHLDLGAGWYYNEDANMGQDTVLFNWLNKISKTEAEVQNLL
jgi:acetyl esterase/lipase